MISEHDQKQKRLPHQYRITRTAQEKPQEAEVNQLQIMADSRRGKRNVNTEEGQKIYSNMGTEVKLDGKGTLS